MCDQDELQGIRERIAWMTTHIEAQDQEIASLNRIVGLIQENFDLLTSLHERHQRHHEAVEELMDRPIGRAVVERLLSDLHLRDEAARRAQREEAAKVVTSGATFISEQVNRV